MSQASPTIGANKSGILYRQEDNDAKQALMTHHKGAAAPGYAQAGTLWVDDSGTPWRLKFYDGSDWITLADINAGSNTVSFYHGTSSARLLGHAPDTGSTNAYETAPAPAITSYITGQIVTLKPASPNTGACTIAVSGLTAKAIKMPNGSNPPASAMLPSATHILIYDGTNFVLANPTVSGLNVSPGISGYTLSNSPPDTVNDIIVSGGACSDTTHTVVMRRYSAMTKQLDALWAVGSGQGGRDTGSIADGTWHAFMIADASNAGYDILFSQSPTAPTLPAGYIYFRRVGSFIRSGGAIVQFSGAREKSGGEVVYGLATPVLDVSVTNLSTTSTQYNVTAPAGITSIGIMCHATAQTTSAGQSVIIQGAATSPYATFTGPSALAAPGSVISTAVANQAFASGILELLPSTTPSIRAVSSVASTTLRVMTIGWVDYRTD